MFRKGAVTAGRCLRFPPRGEKEEAAEEGEHAGAYLNVILPACSAAAHGLRSVAEARPQAQACATYDPTMIVVMGDLALPLRT